MEPHKENPVCVVDIGTGYTKVGYATDSALLSGQPQITIPSTIALPDLANKNTFKNHVLSDLDFAIGEEAIDKPLYKTYYPMQSGVVADWNNYEHFMEQIMFKYLRCDPEDHSFMLTEPPLNTPEAREYTAEIMFESFNVPSLSIAVQAVLALLASWTQDKDRDASKLSGTVIDAGAGVTHIIPVSSGSILAKNLQHIPIAGRSISNFIMKLLKSRGEPIPQEQALAISEKIKEKFGYVCRNTAEEFQKYADNPEKWLKTFHGKDRKTQKEFVVDVGFERFLGAEIFFNPEWVNSDFKDSLPVSVDKCVMNCPVDTRRSLYKNVVLSGGSTTFPSLGKRLEIELKGITEDRLIKNAIAEGDASERGTEIDVKVKTHRFQKHAVWYGGAAMAAIPQFRYHDNLVKTKKDYEEYGSNIFRKNVVVDM